MNYTISSMTLTTYGYVLYEVVTDRLQRVFVAIPRKHTTVALADQIIQHSVDALYAPPKPLSPYLKGP